MAAANEVGVAKTGTARRKPKKTNRKAPKKANRKAPKPINVPITTPMRGLEPVPVSSTRISRRAREMLPESCGL